MKNVKKLKSEKTYTNNDNFLDGDSKHPLNLSSFFSQFNLW